MGCRNDRLRPDQAGGQAACRARVAVPLQPEAAAFAEHYGFTIDVLAAYRPTSKGRVERQAVIVRDHVLAGRSFDSVGELDSAFEGWLPIRRGQVHRTHGQVIAVRAETDRAALQLLPTLPYLVADKHLRRVGKDCLLSFEASFYSVPARQIRPGQRVQLQTDGAVVTIHAVVADGGRASVRGSWVVDQTHWDGLPDGHTRAVTLDPPGGLAGPTSVPQRPGIPGAPSPLAALLGANHAAAPPVARRPLTDYQAAALAHPIHQNWPEPNPWPAHPAATLPTSQSPAMQRQASWNCSTTANSSSAPPARSCAPNWTPSSPSSLHGPTPAG
ncbi:hypothetical protein [Streptomyces sp. SID13031]|uniref:Mu transposase domain-containing protein n=1 Tax=Streptomyces sp. SID13031 TaxID=2706046 RepID=UPI0013CDC127|nr:hypothetical protein [Streptomyces sp. SID13031]